jgi:Xaa-Pro aminopeptidase
METVGSFDEILEDVHEKEGRLREWMARAGLDAIILNRQDQFAWITAGGDNRVVVTSETGFAYLVITPAKKWLVAYTIDANRFMEEQVSGLGYELISMFWHEGSTQERAMSLVKGLRVGSDTPIPGARMLGAELTALHYPLTDLDLRRIRWVARTSHQLLTGLAHEIEPGMTEIDIAARIAEVYTRSGFTVDVMIVGADERVFRYRHPLPTGAALKRYALLHPGARRWGLHANLTRLVHFGPPSQAVRRAVDGVLAIEGQILRRLEPGLAFADLLVEQKRWYAQAGFADEWNYHFQGGITGYILADPTVSLNPAAQVLTGQAFDYFVTITGAKTENLAVLTPAGIELLSVGGEWPSRVIHTERGDIHVPDLLER